QGCDRNVTSVSPAHPQPRNGAQSLGSIISQNRNHPENGSGGFSVRVSVKCPGDAPAPVPVLSPPRPRRVQPEFGAVPGHGGTDGRTDGRTAAPGRCLRVRPASPGNPTPAPGGQRLRCPLLRRGYKTSRNLPKPPQTSRTPRNLPGAAARGVSGAMATGEAGELGELTELEVAIERIVTVFATFAAKEGRKGSLTAGEFKELVRLQLPNLMKDVPSLEEKMSELDVNNDEELRFGEYWRLIGELARAMRRERAAKK
uniref:S100/CaBP-9k-type calcium binding subdomain domain-containing protein n=3 Tax=Muscicapidae TaxID=36291 RepID=A0A803WEL0_FICAL